MRTLTLTILLLPAAAAAKPIEIGAALGGHAFSDSSELGADDDMTMPGPASGGMLGARVAYPLNRRLAVEGEGMLIPTTDDVLGDRATVIALRAHARFDLLTGRFKPFVALGYGVHILRSSSPQMTNDADESYHWGGGVRFALTSAIDLRVDTRYLLVPDRERDGATNDVEVTAGMTYRFGTKPARPRPEPARTNGDGDNDRIFDAADQCPTRAEDRDGFDDQDGCPDLDNDADGIIDTIDLCEREAETRNGWEDDDGCPDQVIAELTGIQFELDSTRLDDASTPLLEHAFQILRDHPALHVEISGHTSADGSADRNLELSLRRAEAVGNYLVHRGIAADRIRAVGHGSDVPVGDNRTEDGRRKNRRIEFRILRADER
ncbi:MAG: OmpA/MotB domain protein [Myxococcales bacterium]|nr:OmpA/MotB domain protein [Myxococcales bacterium]